jgi:hypothetical protein
MHKQHPVFIRPENENAKIWHYMDFSKYLSMLDSKTLFFTRADHFDDKFEGVLPKAFMINIQNLAGEKSALEKLFGNHNPTTEMLVKRFMFKFNKEYKKWVFLNSWHLSEYESMAMWKIYSTSNEGIAVQSTYQRFSESFRNYNGDIWIGKVNYIEYGDKPIPLYNANQPFIWKRKAFEYEKELRAVISKYPLSDITKTFSTLEDWLLSQNIYESELPNGLQISINLETLIENVYVSPTAPKWFQELVKSVTSKYGLGIRVLTSPLADSAGS